MKYIISESQYKKLKDPLSVEFRRRISYKDLLKQLKEILQEDLIACDYTSASDFITDACDFLLGDFLHYCEYQIDHPIVATPRDKNLLYYYLVDIFQDFLTKYYSKNCE